MKRRFNKWLKAEEHLIPRHVSLSVLILWGMALAIRADVIVGTNGDRFTGHVVDETADSVVFELELGGRLTLSKTRIREIQRPNKLVAENPPATTNTAAYSSPLPSKPQHAVDLSWTPSAIGNDTEDWIQLKSGEWLRGRLYYIQNHKVEFTSDELDDVSFNLKDVLKMYPVKPLFTKFNGRKEVFGKVVISNDVVEVFGDEHISLPRDQLTGITPGGNHERDFWSFDLDMGLNLQSGNTEQMTLSISAELARRTPSTIVKLDYLGNYSEAEDVQNINNHRMNGLYDIRLDRDWFLRPVYLDYYRDILANIAYKVTAGAGLGYYIFDRPGLEWIIAGGPGYQYTRFVTVEEGQSDFTDTPAAVLQTEFKADITRRLKFVETVGMILTSEAAGRYSHHAVSTLEFEIRRHLDLNVSFVWDYLEIPQAKADGTVPQHSDFRLIVGVGLKF